MIPPMYHRLRDIFQQAGLTDGFTVQRLMWDDTGDQNERFMVFRPNGSTPIRQGMATEWHVLVDVVSTRFDRDATTEHVQRILDFIEDNPMAFGCAGYITSMGGLPAPIPTTEGRIVYRLAFACLYGK